MTGRFVGRVRLELLERGFSLVDMPPFLDPGLFLGTKQSKTVLQFDSGRWWKFPQLAPYACWLEGMVDQAVPEESVSLATLEFRREQTRCEDKTVDTLHADGSYIRSVYTLYGPSTIYREGDAERPVPRGHTLLMTAMGRARALGLPCTLHRHPEPGPERAVIVCSFEPRHDGPGQPRVYRQVAQMTSPQIDS
jgi:hypothetical protein